jgi:hypothetical protein
MQARPRLTKKQGGWRAPVISAIRAPACRAKQNLSAPCSAFAFIKQNRRHEAGDLQSR